MSKVQKYALSVLAAPELKYDKAGIDKLVAAIGGEFHAIRQLQREDAARFIILGSMLLRLKHSLPARGGFQAVTQKIICDATGWTPATALKNASLAMRLALTFMEKARVSAPDLLALPGEQLTLDVGDNHPARRFLAKLSSFVGELTRTELLIKHGISGVGLKTALEQGEESTPPAGMAEDYFAEVAERVYGFRQIVTSRESLQRLTPQQLETLNQTVTDSYSEFRRLYEEAKGRATAVTV